MAYERRVDRHFRFFQRLVKGIWLTVDGRGWGLEFFNSPVLEIFLHHCVANRLSIMDMVKAAVGEDDSKSGHWRTESQRFDGLWVDRVRL